MPAPGPVLEEEKKEEKPSTRGYTNLVGRTEASIHPTPAEFLMRISYMNLVVMALSITANLISGGKLEDSDLTPYLVPSIATTLGGALAYFMKNYTVSFDQPNLIVKDLKPNPQPEKEEKARLHHGFWLIFLLGGYSLAETNASTLFTQFWKHGGIALTAAGGFSFGEAIYAYKHDYTDLLPSTTITVSPALAVMFAFITFNNLPFLPDTYDSNPSLDFIVPTMVLGISYTVVNMLKLHFVNKFFGEEWFDVSSKLNEKAKHPLIGAFAALCLGQIVATQTPEGTATQVWEYGGYIAGTGMGAGIGAGVKQLVDAAKKGWCLCCSNEPTHRKLESDETETYGRTVTPTPSDEV